MPRAKLTKRAVEGVQPSDRDIILWDTELKGFGVKVTPRGKRAYFLYYRTKEGQQRRPAIGEHGAVTCEQARDTARHWLAEVSAGGDPSATRKAKKEAPTVADLADKYMAEHAPRKKARSAENDERLWRLHVLPAIGRKKVAVVTREDIARLHGTMRSNPANANRTAALLSKAFNLSEVWRWRPDGTNPCRHLEKYPERKRERYLTPDELRRLGKVLAKVEREKWDTPSIVPLIRLLIVTGCRLREIMTARWEWVDFEAGTLTLPDSKTGEEVVLLTPPALELLSTIERGEDNPYIIVGHKNGAHLVNPTKPWHRIRERAGLQDVRMHDLRHTFASAGAGSGLSLPMIGALLHHKQASTTQRYAHLYDDPLRRAAATTAAVLDGWLNGKEAAEVVELPRHKR